MNEKEFLQSVISEERRHQNIQVVTEEIFYNEVSYEERVDLFKDKLKQQLKLTMTPYELVETVVGVALETEFGSSTNVQLSPVFIKMKETVTEGIVANEDVKEKTLALANRYLKQKIGADNQVIN